MAGKHDGVSIAFGPAVSGQAGIQHAPGADPESRLRASLGSQISSVESELEARVAALRSGGAGAAAQEGETQLQALRALQRKLSTSSGMDLIALNAEVRASVSAAQAAVQQIGSATGAGESARGVLAASAAAHRTTEDNARDIFGRRVFDPYLRFASPDDEEAYRRREAERERYVQQQQGLGTPQGELNAANTVLAQMDDARAHGADSSPDFAVRYARERDARDRLQAAVAADRGAPAQSAATNAPTGAPTSDPLEEVAAKSPVSKDAAAALLAAGLSGGQADDRGHGVVVADQRSTNARTI